MLSIFKIVIKIVLLIIMLVLVIYYFIKEIKSLLEFHLFTWHQIFDKDKQSPFNKDLNKIKADIKKFNKLLKIRKEQKKHRDMWNKEIKKRSK